MNISLPDNEMEGSEPTKVSNPARRTIIYKVKEVSLLTF
jgi:hypothetical protein